MYFWGRLQCLALPLWLIESSLSTPWVMGLNGGGECARWAGLGSRLGSKMAAVSGRSKCWSLVTQIGQLHRWSVSTMDGDDSTVTKLLGGSILGRRDWSLPVHWDCLGSLPSVFCPLFIRCWMLGLRYVWWTFPWKYRCDSMTSPVLASVLDLDTRLHLDIPAWPSAWSSTWSSAWPSSWS